jgi:putative FmdB family regulatory protein
MPLYEYVCRECQEESELLVRSSEEQPPCPNCGSLQLERQLSLPVAHGASSPEREPPRGPCGGSCACFPDG